jgi:hypothetical protein
VGESRDLFPQIVSAPYTQDITILSMRQLSVGSENSHHVPSLKRSRFACLRNDLRNWLRDI